MSRKGNKMGVLAKVLAGFGYEGADQILSDENISIPSRGRQKSRRRKSKNIGVELYKPAFSCGFRGFPRTQTRPGSVPAPTMDEVRWLEREYDCRLIVRSGLIFFKADDQQFDRNVAAQRLLAR